MKPGTERWNSDFTNGSGSIRPKRTIPMKRRTLLGAAAGSLGAASLGGCLVDGGARDSDNRSNLRPEPTTRPPTTTPPRGDDFRFDPESDDPFDRIERGNRSAVVFADNNRPHDVQSRTKRPSGSTTTVPAESS